MDGSNRSLLVIERLVSPIESEAVRVFLRTGTTELGFSDGCVPPQMNSSDVLSRASALARIKSEPAGKSTTTAHYQRYTIP